MLGWIEGIFIMKNIIKVLTIGFCTLYAGTATANYICNPACTAGGTCMAGAWCSYPSAIAGGKPKLVKVKSAVLEVKKAK